MKILRDFLGIFYPELCANCDCPLTQHENTICTFCRHDLPLTNFLDYSENNITAKFYGRIHIEKACSLLIYNEEGITKKLIHELKYRGNQKIGTFFGHWLGVILKQNNEFSDIDYIVPVPLYKKKQHQRGYNQVSKFGESISSHLGKPFLENILLRTATSKTQTFKNRFERFNTIDKIFKLNDKTLFKNKHILLIDDVITTGATSVACAKEVQKTGNVKISILTMTHTA
jgi:competence protein ComFC